MTNPMLAELDAVVRLIDQYDASFDDEERASIGAKEDTLAVNFLRTHHATLADMAKRLEAAERDAGRYRWLRSLPSLEAERVMCPNAEGGVVMYQGRELDKRIDATQEGE